ncbi:MAG: mandelate racemase/muconate lactonizing enzyme family protein [Acidiferrobacterales bacterium]|nr:mandelate racemase/muconate lactonizing enzyme family protein [Acidiferrobacterales bacterium]
MRIQSIEVFQIDLPYAGGTYRLSNGREYKSFDATIVRVTAEDGTEGWGESTPFGANYIAAHALGVRAGIAEIAPALLGSDPRHVDRVNALMDQTLAGHAHAKTPLDLACWDIFAKSVDMPVYELLGGGCGVPMPVISSIPADTPEKMRQNVSRHRSKGYRGHSVKIGALDAEGGPGLDAERIQACLADRVDGEFFLVDANGSMTVENALRMFRLLPSGLDFVLEAPCSTIAETVSLRERIAVPIMLDELVTSDISLMQAIRQNALDGFGLKISKAGGLTQARRQRDIGLAAGLTMSVQDTVGSEIALAGILHLAQTVPEKSLRCILDVRDMVSVSTGTLSVSRTDQGLIASDTPGLGVEPDIELLGQPVASWLS